MECSRYAVYPMPLGERDSLSPERLWKLRSRWVLLAPSVKLGALFNQFGGSVS